jgi:CelD/BcsL family acetyltransferase involved in cellulose biosynthesis
MGNAGDALRLSFTDPRWLDFVAAHEDAGPFHHPAWAELLCACYGFEGFALAFESEGRVVAGLPVLQLGFRRKSRRWVSLPFTDFCPPLGVPSGQSITSALEGACARAGVAHLEVRAPLDALDEEEPAAFRHVLALTPDPDHVFASFRSSLRNTIRQSEKLETSGAVTVRRASCEADLADVFYRLHVETRRRLGVPVQPRRFFRALWEQMLEPGLGFALLAYSEERPVGGAVFLTWKRTMIYKFSASLRPFQHLRPSQLLLWHAIRGACRDGFDEFDFGRTDHDGKGLRAFKLGWGSVEEPLAYSVIGRPAARSGNGAAARTLRPVLQRSPPWVSRAVGELLYKYAA